MCYVFVRFDVIIAVVFWYDVQEDRLIRNHGTAKLHDGFLMIIQGVHPPPPPRVIRTKVFFLVIIFEIGFSEINTG